MILYLIGWKKTPVWQTKPQAANFELSTKVSIIIPARNEEENILNCLSSLYKQTYLLDNYEIIVVNDHSADRTAEFVEKLDIPNLKLVSLSQSQSGKKKAIAEGVFQASGKLIITTDADCEMGEKWLSAIVSFYEKHKSKMIIAPVLLKDEKTFQDTFQSQEMIALTACAGASLYYNLPVLCSGANLVYEKETFISINGFEGIEKTATGDDVFLMLKVHEKFPKQIHYLKSKEAAVFTHPEKKTITALNQRKRWASKTFFYGFSHVSLIAVLIFATNFLILLSGILSVINLKFALALATSFSAKCIVDFMLLHSASSFFGKRINPVSFFFASILYPVYVSVIGLIAPFTTYSWKGRQS